ncbi:hypothetical protein B7R22_07375 [Subtercola boreus]|uniref:Uncharacterized protein n=1 Tax=Subtercola boreus TaxID=120213 RepID=A0A3E0VZJ1_9MICO|nr:hypothetical protein [Subtercola boreus]RFA15025.1 hypothetical protein B7R22_07375 [Subtercola boreus]
MTANEPSGELPPRKTTADERETRAEEALQRIFAGGDLGAEATALSNDFTDEYTGRFRAWLRRVFRRSPRRR